MHVRAALNESVHLTASFYDLLDLQLRQSHFNYLSRSLLQTIVFNFALCFIEVSF